LSELGDAIDRPLLADTVPSRFLKAAGRSQFRSHRRWVFADDRYHQILIFATLAKYTGQLTRKSPQVGVGRVLTIRPRTDVRGCRPFRR
jgi:hypothetical protein